MGLLQLICHSSLILPLLVYGNQWPGENKVKTVDISNYFGENLSGLNYQPATDNNKAIMWAVQNNPSMIYKLIWNETYWTSDGSFGWSKGKALSYPSGESNPDSEDLTKAEWDSNELYVCAERDDNNIRLSVLRYLDEESSSILKATHEWDFTQELNVGDNLGFEGITWVPDSYLVENNFFDDNLKQAYNPNNYPNHGTGLFFLGLEQDGHIYVYSLRHESPTKFDLITSFSSGEKTIMSLSFDRDTGYLWTLCDNSCTGAQHVLDLNPRSGRFAIISDFQRPSSLGNYNNEGFTTAPESECDESGYKHVFWADDDNDNNHAMCQDSIPCDRFI